MPSDALTLQRASHYSLSPIRKVNPKLPNLARKGTSLSDKPLSKSFVVIAVGSQMRDNSLLN
jgi:hypothetical protein